MSSVVPSPPEANAAAADRKITKLLEPVSFGGLRLKNRIALAPLTRGRSDAGGIPNAVMADYYRQRSGAGLLISEGAVISEQGLGWNGAPGLYKPEQVEGWKQVTAAVHEAGSVIVAQLWHLGRSSHSSFRSDRSSPVAPSAIKLSDDYPIHTPIGRVSAETPRALETEEMAGIAEQYKRAAAAAVEAGFDGVEIHGANGYLLDQFIQSRTNHRTDKYGGSIQNRLRLPLEVIDAVLEVVPRERVGIRMSPNGVYNDMGSPDYRETFTAAVKAYAAKGVGFIHVLDGVGFGFHKLGEPFSLADVRAHYRGLIIGNSGYSPQTAEAAVQSSNADLIAFGRPFISTPDLPERIARGLPLAPDAPLDSWFRPTGRIGYTDFPTYDQEQVRTTAAEPVAQVAGSTLRA